MKELSLKILFIHFLNILKVVKERGYIPRNGKFPKFEERASSSQGYQISYLILLRKFIENIFNKQILKIKKEKDRLEYKIYSESKYNYGSDQFFDNILKKSLLLDTVNISRNRNQEISFEKENHKIRFNLSTYSDYAYPYCYYSFNFEKKQIFIDDFFDEFKENLNEEIDNLSSEVLVKNLFSSKLSSLFLDLKLKNMIKKQEVDMKIISEAKEKRKEISEKDKITVLTRKYSVTKQEISSFVERWRSLVQSSNGFSETDLFNYQKGISYSETNLEGYLRFEYEDFSNVA